MVQKRVLTPERCHRVSPLDVHPSNKTASSTQEQRSAYSKQKANEFQEKCGKIWEEYKACVQEAVKERKLDIVLQQAREENPLVDPVPPNKQ